MTNMETDPRTLYHQRFGLDLPPEIPAEMEARLAPILAPWLGRSVCRGYRPEPVPEGLLSSLLACAQSAPSKSDLQQYAIIVVKDAAARGSIAGWLPSMPWIAEAPLFLVFCGDIRRNQRICGLRGRPHANNNQDSFLNAAMDATLAMSAFMQAADAAGLGTCPISHVRNHLPRMKELLALPPGVFPVAGLAAGFPKQREPLSMRLPPSLVVHTDRYDDSGLEAGIAAYDTRRNDAQPIRPEKQRNAHHYPRTEICTWSDQVSRQLSLPERETFREFLMGHGFDLE